MNKRTPKFKCPHCGQPISLYNEKAKARRKRYYEKHRTRILAYQNAYNAKRKASLAEAAQQKEPSI